MSRRSVLAAGALLFGVAIASAQGDASVGPQFLSWATRPPLGWNSWDCFATTVTESQTRAHADYMAGHLKSHGWEYVVVDIQWYEPGADSYNYRSNADLVMDQWGRLLPAVNRFPSAADGVGFKALGDYIHGRGLKFGIHLMRGIPRQAVHANTPVLGTSHHARDIANTNSICPWNPDMYGVDMSKPGAQAYYNSVFDLIASWGVDYVKVDDISRPYHDHEAEIEAVRRAIDQTGRKLVLSLSPGETALTAGAHVMQHANLWRVSDDLWDNWPSLYDQFERLRNWTPFRGPGHWPDADMLPLGVIDQGRRSTRLTRDEQITLMTLWCIARSPLMHGGDMTRMDDFTLSLLTNDEVLAVNQNSTGNHELFHRDDGIGWVAEVPGSNERYLALFNAPKGPQLKEREALFGSERVDRQTPRQGVEVDVSLNGARKLYLVATDAGDGLYADHVDWLEPRLIGADAETRLTELEWTRARTGWQEVRIGRGAEGKPISVGGTVYTDGIGAHAESVIEYDLPEGIERFKAFAALDDRGTRLDGGATVRFYVFTNEPFAMETKSTPVPVQLAELGFTGPVAIRDLWRGRDLGVHTGEFSPALPSHGSGLYKVSAAGEASVRGGDASVTGGAGPYVFSYFTGNGEDGLHLAWSRDAYEWKVLNDGKSYLTPTVGTAKLLRDPCIVQGPDGTFHMVWTTGWTEDNIGYARSPDLIHWSDQKEIPVMRHVEGVRNCWAPEIAYDTDRNEFIIIWASTVPGRFPETARSSESGYNHRMYYSTTKDFEAFTPAAVFYDPGFSVIDATFLHANGLHYLIIKDETRNPPKKHLRIAVADDLRGPFGDLLPPFTRDWVEGPTALKVGEDYIVYFDAYRDRRYEAMRSRDLRSWEDITDQISFPRGAKHGTAIRVPNEVVRRLISEENESAAVRKTSEDEPTSDDE